jgi:protein-tyrosine-phosphatase/DNA-binding HxlR family transcriptional regulator
MSTDLPSVERRVAVHAALADPARLRIVDALAIGDLAPSEIQKSLGVPSNLLAHHLGVLEASGLIERSRSDADRRRTYIRLAPGARALVGASTFEAPRRIVFVCTANSARSQLAAAIWTRESAIPVASAGTHPALEIVPGARDAAARRGLQLDANPPRSIDSVRAADDWIITVCDAAHEEFDGEDVAHWSVPDPVRIGTEAAFDDAYEELSERIRTLLPHLAPSH